MGWMMFCSLAYGHLLKDFLIFDDWNQPLVFWLENRHETPIDGMTLFFLESDDCQSGYLKTYKTDENHQIHLKPEQILSLNTRTIYQVMQDLEVLNANSMLLRLTYQKKHLAEFVGGCEDQGINCCLPIACQKETKDCIFKINARVQPFHFEQHKPYTKAKYLNVSNMLERS